MGNETRTINVYHQMSPDDSGDDITDVISLLTKIGIDRLGVLKDLLKGIEKYDLKLKWKNSKFRERTTNSY